MALQGELELELEDEFEDEFEDELEAEWEDELEGDFEFEDEFEGEEFLGKFLKRAFRKVRSFVKRAAPILRRVAKVAAPIVGTAIGGPAGTMVAGGLSRVLESEGELETELELEGELELEDEYSGEAEWLADAAARARSTSQARSLASASAVATLSVADRAALRRVLPHIVRGTDILARILRQRRATRPAVRVIPSIVRRSASVLRRNAEAGNPVDRKMAGKVVAGQVRRVLGNPKTCAHAMTKALVAKGKTQRRRQTVRG
ncbi:MAG: hypothetical protein IPM29_06935 [Planctomycetes bacterium]|nr:hypothetical protein [Planctomycetota bacterium]